jgi:hypothetical protein
MNQTGKHCDLEERTLDERMETEKRTPYCHSYESRNPEKKEHLDPGFCRGDGSEDFAKPSILTFEFSPLSRISDFVLRILNACWYGAVDRQNQQF